MLFELAAYAQQKGWPTEALLRAESQKQERAFRRREHSRDKAPKQVQ